MEFTFFFLGSLTKFVKMRMYEKVAFSSGNGKQILTVYKLLLGAFETICNNALVLKTCQIPIFFYGNADKGYKKYCS